MVDRCLGIGHDMAAAESFDFCSIEQAVHIFELPPMERILEPEHIEHDFKPVRMERMAPILAEAPPWHIEQAIEQLAPIAPGSAPVLEHNPPNSRSVAATSKPNSRMT